eukprot:RCo034791
MEALVQVLRDAPPHWVPRAAASEVRDEVLALYPYRWTNFLYELAGVLSTPYVLWFTIPHHSQDIVDFLHRCTVSQELPHTAALAHFCAPFDTSSVEGEGVL